MGGGFAKTEKACCLEQCDGRDTLAADSSSHQGFNCWTRLLDTWSGCAGSDNLGPLPRAVHPREVRGLRQLQLLHHEQGVPWQGEQRAKSQSNPFLHAHGSGLLLGRRRFLSDAPILL